ncbi:TRAP-type C4-dicarboxylate transport system permease small subunit [Aliiruegeria haliotis]|uniref:TRAP transporter small permease protein n=1 Tax=Aliiruegeria haliotis TaxID=1280846 RepID=A0A2T0RSU2_9RHOB|nr:TRAP transporter small permease [Aliiruegeria haliotis]PRY24238.1 TRAP-type C4-dicarboxylate transport system permease small subunit [Aliiruegeria haliotis]
MSNSLAFVQRIEGWLGLLSKLCLIICAIALTVLVASFGWLVWGRYVMNVTPTWVEQLGLLLVAYIAFLGAAVGIHEQFHLGVTLFRDALGPKVSGFLRFIIDIILASFGAVMLYGGIVLFNFGWDTLLPMLNIPESFRTLAMVCSGGLIMLFAGCRAVFRVIYWRNGERYPDPVHHEES